MTRKQDIAHETSIYGAFLAPEQIAQVVDHQRKLDKPQITQSQINAIARKSKGCHPQGLGHGVAVFANGDSMWAISSNDIVARGDGNGGWDYRIAYIATPMTRAEVAEYLNERI